MRVIPIDDALREVDATLEARRERPSPYTEPKGQLLEFPCRVPGCGLEYPRREQRSWHEVNDHTAREIAGMR